jgi:cation diffusion facilitator CzcD-associated flavoprotein CzcO/predicted ATP-grasp superfamily ATP-dependent carboligase
MRHSDASCHVAIIGAGPYGLAAAAHLHAKNVETRIFGEPMEFWKRHMPRGMFLRSSTSASNLDDPEGRLELDRYRSLHGIAHAKPVPLEDFVRYGHWFQQQAVPDVDQRRVSYLAENARGFRVRTEDGEEFHARRVVVATGISPFAQRPAQFAGLPASLVSHSFDHSDLRRFAGQRVLVVGAGQSALESAALLHETGADVEVVARTPATSFLLDQPRQASFVRVARRVLSPIVRPPFDIMGPRVVSWLIAWPRLFGRSPRALQDFLTTRAVRPAGASWLVPRLASVRITTGRTIAAAIPTGSQLRLRLDDGTERLVDHLLLATGYRVDAARYAFLAPTLLQALRTRDGYPELEVGFESSVPGLHFLGTPAAGTFGPLCRFVVGTRYTARALTRHISGLGGNGHTRPRLSTANDLLPARMDRAAPTRKPWAVVLSSDAVGLGAVRSLHAGSVPTLVVMLDPWEPVRVSRYGHKVLVPKSHDVEAAILDVLYGINREPRPVLIPTSDLLAHFVAKHRAHLEERFRCCIPSDAAMTLVLDKARDTQLLRGTQIPFPKTVQELPASPAELVHQLDLPLIVKPRTYLDKEGLGWRNVVVRSLADADAFYRTSSAVFSRVIAQELIPGPDEALWECMCLFDANGEIARAFTFRKLSTMPAHYGATSRGRSERNDTLLDLAAAIGKRFNYVGIADIDVKYDARDGRYKYLELNPRLGLCHYFGTRCGVNLTFDAYRLACGEDLPERVPQVEGRTFLAVSEEIGGRLQDGDSLLAVLRGLARALMRRPVGAYFAWDDVWPGPFAVARIFCRLLAKAWRGQLGAAFTKEYDQAKAVRSADFIPSRIGDR